MSQDKDKIADALHALASGSSGLESAQTGQPAHPVPNPEPAKRRQKTEQGVTDLIADALPEVSQGQSKLRPATPVQYSLAGSIRFRQTLIPPCLVCGTILSIFSLIYYLQPPTASIRYLEPFWAIGFGLVGVVLIGLAVTNMKIVKNQLMMQKPRS